VSSQAPKARRINFSSQICMIELVIVSASDKLPFSQALPPNPVKQLQPCSVQWPLPEQFMAHDLRADTSQAEPANPSMHTHRSDEAAEVEFPVRKQRPFPEQFFGQLGSTCEQSTPVKPLSQIHVCLHMRRKKIIDTNPTLMCCHCTSDIYIYIYWQTLTLHKIHARCSCLDKFHTQCCTIGHNNPHHTDKSNQRSMDCEDQLVCNVRVQCSCAIQQGIESPPHCTNRLLESINQSQVSRKNESPSQPVVMNVPFQIPWQWQYPF
jgi:hypothetical protein